MTTAIDDAYAIRKSRKNAGYSPTEAAEYIGSGREVISAYECGHKLLKDSSHRAELEDLYEVTLPPIDDNQTFSAPLNINEVIPRARKILKHSVTQAGNMMGVDQVAVRDWQRGKPMASSSILLATWYFLEAEKASTAAGIHVKFTPESITRATTDGQPFFDGTDSVEWAKAEQLAVKPAVKQKVTANATHPQQMQRIRTKKRKVNTPTPTPTIDAAADRRRLALIASIMNAPNDHISKIADHAHQLYYEVAQ